MKNKENLKKFTFKNKLNSDRERENEMRVKKSCIITDRIGSFFKTKNLNIYIISIAGSQTN